MAAVEVMVAHPPRKGDGAIRGDGVSKHGPHSQKLWCAWKMNAKTGASAKLAKSGRAETEGNAEPEIFTGEGVCKRLLSDEVSSWEDVHVQLNTRSAGDVKTLCGQLCEQAARTKAECISKIIDSLQGQD